MPAWLGLLSTGMGVPAGGGSDSTTMRLSARARRVPVRLHFPNAPMIDGSRHVAILMRPMRNAAIIVLLAGLLAAPAAASLVARASDEGLSVNDGRGLVWIEAKGR